MHIIHLHEDSLSLQMSVYVLTQPIDVVYTVIEDQAGQLQSYLLIDLLPHLNRHDDLLLLLHLFLFLLLLLFLLILLFLLLLLALLHHLPPPPFCLSFPARPLGFSMLVRFFICDHLAIVQVVTFWLWVMILAEEGCVKMQVNRLVKQKESRNKEQQKAEKHRRKWTRKKKSELSSTDSKAGGEPVSLGLAPPKAVRFLQPDSILRLGFDPCEEQMDCCKEPCFLSFQLFEWSHLKGGGMLCLLALYLISFVVVVFCGGGHDGGYVFLCYILPVEQCTQDFIGCV